MNLAPRLARLLFVLCALCVPCSAAPQQATVGVFLQNVNDIDMKSSLFTLDFYVWFRWSGSIDPSQSFEFTNIVEKWGMTKDAIYPEPVDLPDGSHYQCFHVQGKFNRKFDLRSYPLDEQELPIEIEDSRNLAGELAYQADTANSGYERDIGIPGWDVDGSRAVADVLTYPTTFGRPQGPGGHEKYARFVFSLKISRPWAPYLIRMLVPLLVIMLSSFVPFYLSASYADARIGISVTALLSAVALHLTVSADLPHVGYIRLIDKIYNLAYLVIFATLLASVVAIRRRDAGDEPGTLVMDRLMRRFLFVVSAAGLVALVYLR